MFVKNKTDIFVNLPTGAGKSMIYLALPIIFDSISNISGHIVVVVSPLSNDWLHQDRRLQRRLGEGG